MSPHSLMHMPPELLRRAASHEGAAGPGVGGNARRLAGWLCVCVVAVGVVAAMF